MTKKEIQEKAKQLGIQAFENQLKSTPILDKNLNKLIEEVRPVIGNKIGSSSFIYKSWLNGWHSKNIIQGF